MPSLAPGTRGGFLFLPRLPLFELARVLVRYYHVASFIVNANHGAMCTAVELPISNRISRIPKRLEVRRPLREVWLRVSAQSAF